MAYILFPLWLMACVAHFSRHTNIFIDIFFYAPAAFLAIGLVMLIVNAFKPKPARKIPEGYKHIGDGAYAPKMGILGR